MKTASLFNLIIIDFIITGLSFASVVPLNLNPENNQSAFHAYAAGDYTTGTLSGSASANAYGFNSEDMLINYASISSTEGSEGAHVGSDMLGDLYPIYASTSASCGLQIGTSENISAGTSLRLLIDIVYDGAYIERSFTISRGIDVLWNFNYNGGEHITQQHSIDVLAGETLNIAISEQHTQDPGGWSTYDFTTEVPEPAALLLLGLGAIAFRKRS